MPSQLASHNGDRSQKRMVSNRYPPETQQCLTPAQSGGAEHSESAKVGADKEQRHHHGSNWQQGLNDFPATMGDCPLYSAKVLQVVNRGNGDAAEPGLRGEGDHTQDNSIAAL